MHGGALQAVGWALREDGHPGLIDSSGPPENYNPDFMPVDLESYAIATSMDMPEMHGGYVEVYDPEGPFGAKAAGEISRQQRGARRCSTPSTTPWGSVSVDMPAYAGEDPVGPAAEGRKPSRRRRRARK